MLANQVTEDEGALTRFLVNSSRAVTAVAERRDDLSGLVTNANETAGAIAAENVALSRALELLPTTLRRANTTFVNLRATLDDLDVLVAESKPATKDLAPFLRELRPLVRDARPTIRDLRTLVRRDGADNDLVEATRKMPALQRVATPAFSQGRAALQRAQPRARVHPPLHARLRRLAARLRPGRRQLRRQRPLRAHPADLQRVLVHGQPGRRRAHADPAGAALRRRSRPA